jgi:hypothetical protein
MILSFAAGMVFGAYAGLFVAWLLSVWALFARSRAAGPRVLREAEEIRRQA